MIDKKYFLPIFEERINEFVLQLDRMPEIIAKGFKISSEAWMRRSDFCMAYISCSRSPIEESIEFTLDISVTDDIFSIEAGIYLSDGTLIQDFGSVSISGESLDEIKSNLEKYFDRLGSNELVSFSRFLLEQQNKSD